MISADTGKKLYNITVIQPAYSTDYTKSDEYFEREMAMMDECDSSSDIIVMPESCDAPCFAKTKEEFEASVARYNAPLLQKAAETARRCNSILFINATERHPAGLRNTTYAFNCEGEVVGHYYKQHPTNGEVFGRKLDSRYTFEYSEPTVIEIEGIRFGFLICYDFYFYEAFSNIARQNVDVIIGCSHQRSDTHDALEIMSRFLAYNTNAYVLRSSVSMGADSPVGGCSMIVDPRGNVLCNMKSEVGLGRATIDIDDKYLKPAGFGGALKPHYEYVEEGRRPWKYRPAGGAIVPPDRWMPYPRVCAHRGFNTIAPENSMPAYGAAVALGADEIEFDLWPTKDGEIVSLHDPTLDRVSTGTGKVWDYTYDELLTFDFGVKYSDEFRGLKILRFDEILKKFSCHTIMNIHLKTIDEDSPYDEALLKKVIGLIEQYDAVEHSYIMCGNDTVQRQIGQIAPHIHRCVGAGNEPWRIVDRAIELGCEKVQLFKPYFDQEMIDKARAHGIITNVFWSDDTEEAVKFLEMGIDVILTNDFQRVNAAAQDWMRKNGKV